MADIENGSGPADASRAKAEEQAQVGGCCGREAQGASATAGAPNEWRARALVLEQQNEILRQRQAELESSRDRYLELFEVAPVGYCVLGRDGHIVEANTAAATLLGSNGIELRGKPFSTFVDGQDQPTFDRRRQVLFENATPQGFALRLTRTGRVPFWVWLDARVSRRADGEPVLHVAINDLSALKLADAKARTAAEQLEQRVADRTADLLLSQAGLSNEVSRRNKSEEMLQRSEGQLRAILDAAAEAIVTSDLQGNIELFNVAAERIFGWKAEEVIGKKVSVLMPAPESVQHDGYIERYLRTGERRVIGAGREVIGMRKDGTTFPLALSVSDMQTEHSRKFIGILRDLTERRRLEEQFRQAQKMEAVARLASGIAHDFNNLLMGVIACANAARRALPADHEAVLPIDEIKGSAERGATLTRQLLSYSRQNASRPVSMRLNQSVSTVASILRKVLGEDIQIEVDLCHSGGPMHGDPSSLEQVLMNLAVNARDAMVTGGKLRLATREVELAQVRQTRSRALAPGRYIELVVEDSGCGIPPDVLEHVFEPFFTTKPVGEGTGLGLYSVYGIVDRLGGALELESEVGRGTKFTILFPRDEVAPTAVAGAKTESPGATRGHAPAAPRTILVVEDERLIRLALKHMLGRQNFEVLMAENFKEARRTVEEHKGAIDLLLTDIVLPGGSGGALAEWVQRTRPHTRVVFMSAYPTEVLVQQGRIPPGTTSLEKPFDEPQLNQALREAWSRAPSAG